MLLLGKKWDEIISDFETRPVLVVLREIYEATKPWITYSSDKELQLEYKSNYECLLEKITQKYSREYLTVNMIGEHLKINITTYQEEASRSKEIETDEVNIICTTIQGMVLHLTGMKADFFTMPLTGQRRSILRAGSIGMIW